MIRPAADRAPGATIAAAMGGIRRVFAAAAIGAAVVLAPAADAGLPAAVGGQEVPTLAPMLKRVAPAVVNIATRGRARVADNPLLADPFFRRFFNLPQFRRERPMQSVGSGVIVDAENGYALTNNHVVANADTIVVTLRDRRQIEAELVGTDPETDIAVLRIPADDLTGIDLGDSDALEVGDFVVAIGNPFGIGQTVTSGIVSALRRSGLGIEGIEDFIQTDASINPGNSGGALVTLTGELIGINTAIIGPAGGNVGIGFAIPINMARRVMDQIVTYGAVRRGLLGVAAQDLTPDLAEALGVRIDRGAVVTHVGAGSPAEEAGLEPGDVIVAADGEPIRGATQLRNEVGLLRVGETVELEVLRNGATRTLRATVAEPERTRLEGKGAARRLAGATVGPIEPSSPLYGRVAGVAVASVEDGSPAWRIGLREGDVIFEVNGQPVRGVDDFTAAIAGERRQLALKIRRDDAQVVIVVR